jgi:hypothetical protein
VGFTAFYFKAFSMNIQLLFIVNGEVAVSRILMAFQQQNVREKCIHDEVIEILKLPGKGSSLNLS